MKKDVVLVGFPGSGKSFIAKELNSLFCYKILEVGKFVYAESVQESLSTYDCANKYFSLNQYTHFVQKVVTERKTFPNETAVIVGPRTLQEIEFLQFHLRQPVSIALIASYKTRQLRRSFQPSKMQDIPLWKRDQIENAWGLSQAIKFCQYQIINEFDRSIEDITNILYGILCSL